MDFSVSTHRQHWLFTVDTLRDILEQTTQLAAEACAAGTAPEVARTISLKPRAGPGPAGEANGERKEGDLGLQGAGEGKEGKDQEENRNRKKRENLGVSPLLTVEEESMIKHYYERKIQETCGRSSKEQELRRSDKVQATAVMYFKRFYLSNSVLEHDPKLLIKTEEQMTNVSSLSKATGLDELAILGEELPLLQGLSFHLAVFHPYRAVPALVEGARQAAKRLLGASPPSDRVKELHDRAREALDNAMVTDLPLLHTPSRLAVALVVREGKRMEDPPFDVMEMLTAELGGGTKKEGWGDLLEEVQTICEQMDVLLPYKVDKDRLKAINKKLKAHALWAGGGAERRGSGAKKKRKA